VVVKTFPFMVIVAVIPEGSPVIGEKSRQVTEIFSVVIGEYPPPFSSISMYFYRLRHST